jgi:large subunit ribosomal protein L17
MIEGIGPKIAQILNEKGILTFADLSKTKVTLLKEALAEAGSRFKMHDPSTWAEQAKLAAAGEKAKLAQLQAELKGRKR